MVGPTDARSEHRRDIDIAFRSRGVGPRIVLIHGLGQDHTMWADVQTALGDYTTEALDIRGHGSSTLGEPEGTLAQLASDLLSFLEARGPAICVGFSLGGSIALWAASERPDLVTGVVAVATSSIVGRVAAEAMQRRIDTVAMSDAAALREIVREDTRAQLAVHPELVESIAEGRLSAIGDARGYLNGARAVVSMREDSLHDRLERIKVPVLVVSGENDAWCPRRAAELMLEQLPHAAFVELPEVGHLVTDDDADALINVVEAWLQKEQRT